MVFADAAVGAVAAMPTQSQPIQPVAGTEHQLFDYLVDMDKVTGKTGEPGDPAALIGSALHSLEGIVQQAQSTFDANRQANGLQLGGGAAEAQPGGSPAAGQPNSEQTLQHAISFMWAAANVSVAINSVTVATGSVNTLIKQQ